MCLQCNTHCRGGNRSQPPSSDTAVCVQMMDLFEAAVGRLSVVSAFARSPLCCCRAGAVCLLWSVCYVCLSACGALLWVFGGVFVCALRVTL